MTTIDAAPVKGLPKTRATSTNAVIATSLKVQPESDWFDADSALDLLNSMTRKKRPSAKPLLRL